MAVYAAKVQIKCSLFVLFLFFCGEIVGFMIIISWI